MSKFGGLKAVPAILAMLPASSGLAEVNFKYLNSTPNLPAISNSNYQIGAGDFDLGLLNFQSTQQPPAVSLSKTMREALKEVHDESAKNKFTDAVFAGKATTDQYTRALKQNLGIFQCFDDEIARRKDIQPDLKAELRKDLGVVIAGFKEDLGIPKEGHLDKKELLGETKSITRMLHKMKTPEIVACCYQDLGGNAFGTHDIAEAVTKNLGVTNTKGLTVFTVDQFMNLVGLMNKSYTDPKGFDSMIDAAKRFFKAHKVMTDALG